MNKSVAKAVARIAHAGQKYGVEDYFAGHVEKVAARVAVVGSTDAIIVAYLHDVVEDTAVTYTDLVHLGFNANIVNAVKKITRNPDVAYLDYIREIASDIGSLAYTVKLHDLRENLENSKFDGEYSMIARYDDAINIMTEL